jgi:hypothetical protein
MANEYVDIALLRVTDPDGSTIDLEDVVEFKPTVTSEKKPVNTMNRQRRALGYTTSTIQVTWEMTVAMRRGKPEYDWRKAMAKNKILQFMVEEADGGARRSFVDVAVNECSPTFQEDGETRMTVSGLALTEEGDD